MPAIFDLNMDDINLNLLNFLNVDSRAFLSHVANDLAFGTLYKIRQLINNILIVI